MDGVIITGIGASGGDDDIAVVFVLLNKSNSHDVSIYIYIHEMSIENTATSRVRPYVVFLTCIFFLAYFSGKLSFF